MKKAANFFKVNFDSFLSIIPMFFINVIKEKISKIPSSILNEKVKKLGEFTCSYAAILEELMKGKNSEDE